MKNTHLEHPEDTILTGDLNVLDWFIEKESHLSCKIDGSPAIVYGTDPETGTFFCGTKSVFNKRKIIIPHSHEEIDFHYAGKGELADILHACFDNVPRTDRIIQADWIGWGGTNYFKPNLIEYVFPFCVSETIVVSPHTSYETNTTLREAEASFLSEHLMGGDRCFYYQPDCDISRNRKELRLNCDFARQMATLCEFVDKKKATEIKKYINSVIMHGKLSLMDDAETAEKLQIDINLIRLWKLVLRIKDELFLYIDEPEDVNCYINDEPSFHEGYVMTNRYGMYKLVDRETFSRFNFLQHIARQA